jgi:glucoamylase
MEAVPFLQPLNPFNFTSFAEPIMYSFSSLLLAGSFALQAAFALPDLSRVKEREADILKRSVDSFIATESPIASRDLLCNIGSDGACVSGAHSGIVVAGPGKANPDCKNSFQFGRGLRPN